MPGSDGSGSVNLGLGLHNLQEGEQQLIADGQQRRAEAGDPPGPLLRPRDPAGASASANNSPQPARTQAGESEDVETQPPQMSDLSAFHASLQAAHDAAEAGAESGGRQASRGACSGEFEDHGGDDQVTRG